MNFLAHFFLSFKDESLIIGNFLGDFVHGKKYENYPEPIAKGILLHRHIDSFTDQHDVVRQTNKRLHQDFGKYAPVITDVFYDHFLGKHFEQFHYDKNENLSDFSQFIYQTLQTHQNYLPPILVQMSARMQAQDWLTHYATMYGMEQSLLGLSRRAKYATHLHTSLEFLQENYEEIEQDFLAFFPDIKAFVQAKINE